MATRNDPDNHRSRSAVRGWFSNVFGRLFYLGWVSDLRAGEWPRPEPAPQPVDGVHPDLRAGMGRRLTAQLAHAAAWLAAAYVFSIVWVYVSYWVASLFGVTDADTLTAVTYAGPYVLAVLWVFLPVPAEAGEHGGFFDRRLVGLAVVDAERGRPGIGRRRALHRRFLALLDLVFLPVALAWAATDDGRWPHDRFTNTRVAIVPPDGNWKLSKEGRNRKKHRAKTARRQARTEAGR